jgi:hypothetical protein
MVIEGFLGGFLDAYNGLLESLPENLRILPPLFFIAVIIALYSLFIWFFYRLLARRDVLKLNLAQYNTQKHSGWVKFFATLLYIVEFIIIAPIAVFFWFAVLSICLIILAKEIEVGTVILICAALISAIRITAYFKEDLSKDLAKMVPFTLLGVTILTPSFIDVQTSISRVTQVPLFFSHALYYFLFIVCLETVLRLFFLLMEVAVSMKEE